MSARPLNRLAVIVSLAVAGPTLLASPQPPQDPQDPQDPKPTFTATVARVPISAVVTDSKNRRVRTLTRDEFEVFENGEPRTIVDFSVNERAPIAIALLFDTSGSMAVGSSLTDAKSIVHHLLEWIEPKTDEVALFTFSKRLRQDVGFTADSHAIGRALSGVEPLGSTSLYDAIGEVARVLERRPAARQGIVVVTDGIDTSSVLTPPEVSAAAAAIDVPVYILAAVAHPGSSGHAADDEPGRPGPVDGRGDDLRQRACSRQRRGPAAGDRPPPSIRPGHSGVDGAGLVFPPGQRPTRQVERQIEKRLPGPVAGLPQTRAARATSIFPEDL
jgi:hypothetical protein